MQERLKIRSQLKQMREESVRDYLETKLQAIASREVINDILVGLLQANDQEFLESITQSIFEAKENCRRLKETVETMKREHEATLNKQKEKAKEHYKQESYAEMAQLREELKVIKLNLEAEGHVYNRGAEAVKSQLEASEKANRELKEIVEASHQENLEFNLRISQLSNQVLNYKQKLQESNQIIGKLKSEIQKKELEHEQEIISLKKLHRFQKSQIEKNHNATIQENKRIYDRKMQEYQLNIRQIHQKLKRSENQLQKMSIQLQKQQIIGRQASQKTDLIRQNLAKTEQFLRSKEDELLQARRQLVSSKQQCKSLVEKIESQECRYTQAGTKNLSVIMELKESISKQQNQNNALSVAIKLKEDIIEGQRAEIQSIVKRYSQEIKSLKLQVSLKQSEKKTCLQKLALEIEQNRNSQEEIKNLLKYNAIQQESIEKCECELKRKEEECQAEISTYQQTFRLNIEALESEVDVLKKENAELRLGLSLLEKQLELEQEQEKYYHCYLEEIALLKSQLSSYEKSHRPVLRRCKQKLEQLPKRLNQLQRDKRKLKETVRNQLAEFQKSMKDSFKFMIEAIQHNSIGYNCIQNQREYLKKTKSPNHEKILMDRTMPRLGMQKQSMNSIKKNLKSIQQRYQMAQFQNQSFTNRIDSFLNNS